MKRRGKKHDHPRANARKPLFVTLEDAKTAQESASSLGQWNAILAKIESDGELADFKEAWTKMVETTVPNEASYFLLMRAGRKETGHVCTCFRRMLAAKIAPHVRDYVLIITAEAQEGNAQLAWDWYEDMRGSGLLPDERILTALLKAAVTDPTLAPDVLDVTVRFLPSIQTPECASALEGFSDCTGFTVTSVDKVAADGALSDTLKLKKVDIRESDIQNLKNKLIHNLKTGMKRQYEDFCKFKAWLTRRGPYHVVIDAANVAYGGKKYFDWGRVLSLLKELERRKVESVLVIVHEKWLSSERGTVESIEQLRRSSSAYVVPARSNDDWYWLYAGLFSGAKCIVITNDECRDHAYESLKPAMLAAWRDAHRTTYSLDSKNAKKIVLAERVPYTMRSQIPEDNTWTFLIHTGSWLVVKRVAAGPV